MNYFLLPWGKNILDDTSIDILRQLNIINKNNNLKDVTIVSTDYNRKGRIQLEVNMYSEVNYINIYDIMRGIDSQTIQIIEYDDFFWEDTDIILNTVFNKIVLDSRGQLKAKIIYSNFNTIDSVIFYEKGILSKICYIDYAGSISSVNFYKKSKLVQEVFFDTDQNWIFKRNNFDGSIVVNAKNFKWSLKKNSYENIDEFVYEITVIIIKDVLENKDKIIFAVDEKTPQFLEDISNFEKKPSFILSLLNKRDFDKKIIYQYFEDIEWIISDKECINKNLFSLNKKTIEMNPEPLFNNEGISRQVPYTKVFIYFDNDDLNVLFQMLDVVVQLLERDTKLTFLINIRNFNLGYIKEIFEDVLMKKDLSNVYEEYKSRVSFSDRVTPDFIEEELNDSRILVDLSVEGSSIHQKISVEAMIPIIASVYTKFYKNKKSGIKLDQIEDMLDSIKYYIYNVDNWNDSYMYIIDLIEESQNIENQKKFKSILDNGRE